MKTVIWAYFIKRMTSSDEFEIFGPVIKKNKSNKWVNGKVS